MATHRRVTISRRSRGPILDIAIRGVARKKRSPPLATFCCAADAAIRPRDRRRTVESCLMLVTTSYTDLPTPTTPMRVHVYAPAGDGNYPGLLLYPEIFQQTGPIERLSVQFASHGYVVMAPEIY